MLLHADSEDSDQTGRMPRLIWVFAGRTAILLVLSCRGSHTLGPKYPRYMYTRTYKQYTHCILGSRNTRTYKSKRKHFEHICCLEKKKNVFALSWKNILALGLWEKKSLFFSPPPAPRKSNGQSLNRFSRDVTHMVLCYFLVYFHCNKQYTKANKTDRHPRYPFFHCHLYRHYRNSSHVSCRVILTCAKIRFVLKLDLR